MKQFNQVLSVFALALGMVFLFSFTSMDKAPLEKEGDYAVGKRASMIMGSMKKLNASEQAAILSLIDDSRVGLGRSSSKGSDAKKLAKLKEIIAEMERKMAERFNAKWMAADGSEYDTYEEYYRHQWGTSPDDKWNPDNWE